MAVENTEEIKSEPYFVMPKPVESKDTEEQEEAKFMHKEYENDTASLKNGKQLLEKIGQSNQVIAQLNQRVNQLQQDKNTANVMLESIMNGLIDLLSTIKNQKTVLNMSEEQRQEILQRHRMQQQQQQ